MINRIIKAITARMEDHEARERDLENASRRLCVALSFAKHSTLGTPMFAEVVAIGHMAMTASDTDDLEGLQNCTARLQEFIR
jgi:hypothetical protein